MNTWLSNNFGTGQFPIRHQEELVNATKHFFFQNRYSHSCVIFSILNCFSTPKFSAVTVTHCISPARVAVQYRSHWLLGLIERKLSPVWKHIYLHVQKLASAPYLTSSDKGAKKPPSHRLLNSALSHTSTGVLPDVEIEQTEDVERTTHNSLYLMRQREKPQGKSSMKMDGNSTEKLMNSYV